jgi:hypothetical protein
MNKGVEDIISRVLSALGERPSVEESAKAQTLLLAEILRELSALKAEVRLLGEDDDDDDDRVDDRDDDRDDDDDDTDEDERKDQRSRRSRRDDD